MLKSPKTRAKDRTPGGETGGGSEGAIPVAQKNRDVAAEIVGGGEIHLARPDRAAVLSSQNVKAAYASTLALLLLFLVPVGSQQRAKKDLQAIEAAEEEIRRIPANWMQSYNAGDAAHRRSPNRGSRPALVIAEHIPEPQRPAVQKPPQFCSLRLSIPK